jgi:hypothetical protein
MAPPGDAVRGPLYDAAGARTIAASTAAGVGRVKKDSPKLTEMAAPWQARGEHDPRRYDKLIGNLRSKNYVSSTST